METATRSVDAELTFASWKLKDEDQQQALSRVCRKFKCLMKLRLTTSTVVKYDFELVLKQMETIIVGNKLTCFSH